ncbi:hypothetical protein ABZ826_26040 [Streptomyces sp. NPDC047515]|uniref:hypothetical protein n=1 Tax=Streptomyces sp. NPDC047515 TaxID=3155380 RepID=UPI0033E3C9A2
MSSRRLGVRAAREVAAAATLDDALGQLAATPYRRALDADAGLAAAQRSVAATLLWHLRVLAGWLPRQGAGAVRLLAAGFEISNVEEHLRVLSGSAPDRPGSYRLGGLATAWPRLAESRSPAELRAALTSCAWGDPGDDSAAAVGIGMRISAATRTAGAVPEAVSWAAGRLALLVARELFVHGRPLTEPSGRRAARVLGPGVLRAATFADFRRQMPGTARWAVDGIDESADLWRAEARWWTRVEKDGSALLRGSRLDTAPVLGAVAVLSTDAWRVRAALESAARGGELEAFDALG